MSAIAWLTVISVTTNEIHAADFCLSKSINARLQLTHWQDEDIVQMSSVRASEPWLVHQTESLYKDVGTAQKRAHQLCMFPHLWVPVCWDTLVKVFEMKRVEFFFLVLSLTETQSAPFEVHYWLNPHWWWTAGKTPCRHMHHITVLKVSCARLLRSTSNSDSPCTPRPTSLSSGRCQVPWEEWNEKREN